MARVLKGPLPNIEHSASVRPVSGTRASCGESSGRAAAFSYRTVSCSALHSAAAACEAEPPRMPKVCIPRHAEDFLSPLMRKHGAPSWAQSYLALLRESTTSQEAMNAHILRLFARGAVNAAKVARIMRDPVGGMADLCLESGVALWLQHMQASAKAQQAAALTAAQEQREAAVAGRQVRLRTHDSGASDDGPLKAEASPFATAAAAADAERADAAAPSSPVDPLSAPSSASTSCSDSQRNSTSGLWRRLRLSVTGCSAFKKCARAKDDSSLPKNDVHPLHCKALSLMLSIMMSGASSGSGALPDALPSIGSMFPHVTATAGAVVASSADDALSGVHSVLRGVPSLAQAPSLVAQNSAKDAAENVALASELGVGGALRMLRGSDSKRIAEAASVVAADPSAVKFDPVSASMDAASSVLELFVDKVERDAKTHSQLTRSNSLPDNFFTQFEAKVGSGLPMCGSESHVQLNAKANRR